MWRTKKREVTVRRTLKREVTGDEDLKDKGYRKGGPKRDRLDARRTK